MTNGYIQIRGGYHRCDTCGNVSGPQDAPPKGCVHCYFAQRTACTFTQIEVAFPSPPGRLALNDDTREIEAAIRAAFDAVSDPRDQGWTVPLTRIRAELPTHYDREGVDAALIKLAAHPDVFLSPAGSGHISATRESQEAALAIGGRWDHGIRIDPRAWSIDAAYQVLRMASHTQALSLLAPLSLDRINILANRMGVGRAIGSPLDALCHEIAGQADATRKAWFADAKQGEKDGTLLYRADNDRDWVNNWTDAERCAVREAAARLLERADREENWAYIRERATRWLHA